jgi:hypothetical protein
MNQNDVSRKLAEQICQKKIDEYFKNKNVKLDNENFRLQISFWKELGKTHLTKYDLQKESPIIRALNEISNEKIKSCMNQILTHESEESEDSENSKGVD